MDGTQEQEIVFLRDRTQSRPSSMRQSMRQSLTNSLSRIGSRMRRGKPPKLQRLQSTLDFDALAQNELELKANLYWHIATPIKRWKVERQVPVKLVLQLLKTLLLIVQVCETQKKTVLRVILPKSLYNTVFVCCIKSLRLQPTGGEHV